MSDSALPNAERQRDELLAKRNALREELKSVEELLATAEAFIYQWHAFAEIRAHSERQVTSLAGLTPTRTELVLHIQPAVEFGSRSGAAS